MLTTVYMLVGIPASGKSTARASLLRDFPNATVLCPDDHLMVDGKYMWTPDACAKAWGRCNEDFKRALASGLTVIWDATFVSPRARKDVIRTTKGYRAKVVAYVVKAPFDLCLKRNEARTPDRRVPRETMESMHARYSDPTSQEGFDSIVTVQGY